MPEVDDGLSIRIRLHSQYSTNKYGWQNWVFDQYNLHKNFRILELGCGNGVIWKSKSLPQNTKLLLTDISSEMLEKAQENLRNIQGKISFQIVDSKYLPFTNAHFDVVIANHLLHQFTDQTRVLSEIARVMKVNGTFYTTTMGQNSMQELHKMDGITFHPSFNLENGSEILNRHFLRVERRIYKDKLEVKETQDLLDYISTYKELSIVKKKELRRQITQEIERNGSFKISKAQGIFIAKLT